MFPTVMMAFLPTMPFTAQAGSHPAAQLAHKTPLTVVDPPGPLPAPTAQEQTDVGYHFLGAGTSGVASYADDDAPPPIAPVIVPGNAGDHVVQPASGDPEFLGFTAGPYFPPQGELIDPELLAQLQAKYADGRPTDDTYAFVMFSKRMTPQRLTELEDLGCRLLGYHPYYTQRIALSAAAVARVAALDYVRWIGAPRSWQKVHPRLLEELPGVPDGKTFDVYVDVYDSDLCAQSTFHNVGVVSEGSPADGVAPGRFDDQLGRVWMSNGWQQRALERLGVEVVEYVDSIRAFRARISPASLEQLVALDFVQFVEPDLPDQLTHDESTPQVGSDYERLSANGSLSGEAMAGIIDSGLQIFHEALLHAVYVGWDTTPEGFAYLDNCHHGSHVAGTVLGRPPANHAGYTGNAPGLGFSAARRVRIVKFFDGACAASGASHATLYSYIHNNYSDGTNVSPPPHTVNCSWGSGGSVTSPWTGTEAASRTLDTEVYYYGQVYCFAAGNEGSGASTLRSPAVAKNAFTVGSVNDYYNSLDGGDPGNLSGFSSRGPCGDGRWKPNIVAPGDHIRSVDATGNTGYVNFTGTSMATPHVTGIVAQLADRYDFMRYHPQIIETTLMANAMTHGNVVLTTPSDAHLNTYGAGLINAPKAHYAVPGVGSTIWGFSQASGTYSYADFDISPGCQRIVVCMSYCENASSSGASQALVNDFDMYLDSPINGIDPNMNTGDYFAHQSHVDNTEIRILDAPATGTWRWKIWPRSTSSSVEMSLTVAFIYDAITQSGSLGLSVDDAYVKPFEAVDVTAACYNPAYYASNVYLDSTSSGDSLLGASTALADGIVTDLLSNATGGRDLLLGLIAPGSTRSAVWHTYWATEGVKSFQVNSRGENWGPHTLSVPVTVDGTAPLGPTNLNSATHPIGVQMCSGNFALTWTSATDALSGLDQYAALIDHASSTVPTLSTPGVISAAASVTGMGVFLTPDSNAYYCHLRAVDRSGNYGTTAHYGPFFVHGVDVSTYCTGKINSQFCIPSIGSTGTPQISGNNFTVTCANAINNKNGLLFWGRQPQATPFQGGTLCIQAPVQRTASIPSGGTSGASNCTGTYAFTFTQSYINSHGLHAGDDVYCQWWMRDPNVNSTTGLSNALRFVLCQ